MHKHQTLEGTQQAEREAENLRQEIQTVRELLEQGSVKYRDSDANESLILSVCARPVTYETAAQAFMKVQHQLTPGLVYTKAYSEFFEQRPELRVQANIELLDSLWNVEFDLSVDGLLALADHENVKGRLCVTQAHVDDQLEAQHRAELIQAISLGRATYACAGNNDMRVVNYPSNELPGETTERLEEILAIVTEYRRLQNTPLDELKKQQRRREIEAGRAQNLSLPEKWVPSVDGQNKNTGVQIKAGVPVELSADVIRRLDRNDLVKLVKSYGADLVNDRLGVKKTQQFGNVQVIRG